MGLTLICRGLLAKRAADRPHTVGLRSLAALKDEHCLASAFHSLWFSPAPTLYEKHEPSFFYYCPLNSPQAQSQETSPVLKCPHLHPCLKPAGHFRTAPGTLLLLTRPYALGKDRTRMTCPDSPVRHRGYNQTRNVTASLPVGNDSCNPGGAVARPAWPRLGEGGRTARACQRSPPGAAGWVCSTKLPAAPLGAAPPAVLLLQLGYLPPKCGGAHSPAVHPGSSLLIAEGESKLSPHPGLGVGSRCGVGGYGPWQKTSC